MGTYLGVGACPGHYGNAIPEQRATAEQTPTPPWKIMTQSQTGIDYLERGMWCELALTVVM